MGWGVTDNGVQGFFLGDKNILKLVMMAAQLFECTKKITESYTLKLHALHSM